MSEEMKLSGIGWSHARRDLAMSIAVVVVVVGVGYKLGVIGCEVRVFAKHVTVTRDRVTCRSTFTET
jgi:hypothetical protein